MAEVWHNTTMWCSGNVGPFFSLPPLYPRSWGNGICKQKQLVPASRASWKHQKLEGCQHLSFKHCFHYKILKIVLGKTVTTVKTDGEDHISWYMVFHFPTCVALNQACYLFNLSLCHHIIHSCLWSATSFILSLISLYPERLFLPYLFLLTQSISSLLIFSYQNIIIL